MPPRPPHQDTTALSDAPGTREVPAPLRRRERLALTAAGLQTELLDSFRMTADARSWARFALDALGYRAARIFGGGDGVARHRLSLRDGGELTYRSNRGDVRAIAEVWLSEAYRLPFELRARNIVDLGANIGAAGIWLARRYGGVRVVAVEPVPGNAALARLNFERNRIDAEVLEAAAAPAAGTGRFEMNATSTLGRLGAGELEVTLVTPGEVIDRFPARERIDLLKIDIEGAEQQLFAGDLRWLERVGCLAIELHTDRVDWKGIIERLRSLGFSPHEIGPRNRYRGLADLTLAFIR